MIMFLFLTFIQHLLADNRREKERVRERKGDLSHQLLLLERQGK